MKRSTRSPGGLILAAAGAMMLGLGSAQAQTSADIKLAWCIQMRESLLRNFQAIEKMRAERQAGISRLRPEHQVQATRNLEDWYYKKVGELFEQRRALDAECRGVENPSVPQAPRRTTPPPQQRPKPRANPQDTWRYPPYQRYPDPTDPFSPGVRR